MARYRSKPVEIEAEQFFPDKPLPFSSRGALNFDGDRWYVVTAHGQETTVVAGDWIIPEPDGRGFYPCKADIFEKRYEPA